MGVPFQTTGTFGTLKQWSRMMIDPANKAQNTLSEFTILNTYKKAPNFEDSGDEVENIGLCYSDNDEIVSILSEDNLRIDLV